jgi:hypothetical protein
MSPRQHEVKISIYIFDPRQGGRRCPPAPRLRLLLFARYALGYSPMAFQAIFMEEHGRKVPSKSPKSLFTLNPIPDLIPVTELNSAPGERSQGDVRSGLFARRPELTGLGLDSLGISGLRKTETRTIARFHSVRHL